MTDIQVRAAEICKSIPSKYRGPGGCIAVLKNGQPIHQQTWGYADLDARIPMTSTTHVPICSITKQMVCMMLFSLVQDPTKAIKAKGGNTWDLVSQELKNFLPSDLGEKVSLENLCNNQSGIRDYWAMSTLWGARPEQHFSLKVDAPLALERTQSLHFEPGTEYSYCNLNFHILARVLEKASEVPLNKLLEERLFKPAGMKSTALRPDTANLPKPCVGYEGDEEHGFFPATNRIEWSGDAGVVTTLEDMIAYEQYLDRTWEDPKSPYRSISLPQSYKNGKSADYGYGLGRADVDGKMTLGHGGALRGFRLHRVHMPSERISVVVLFNHEADSGAAAKDILKHLLQVKDEDETPSTITGEQLLHWKGAYLDASTQLAIQITPSSEGEGNLSILYEEAENVHLTHPNSAESKNMTCELKTDILHINHFKENRKLQANRITSTSTPNKKQSDYAGTYFCAEADSTFHCTTSPSPNLLYASFEGFLGKGPAHLVRRLGEDVFALADPRGLDAPAPGDWTCVFHRDEKDSIVGVTIGCWLARKLEFKKVSS